MMGPSPILRVRVPALDGLYPLLSCRSARKGERQPWVGPCQPRRRTRRLEPVIQIDHAGLLTFVADVPGHQEPVTTGCSGPPDFLRSVGGVFAVGDEQHRMLDG